MKYVKIKLIDNSYKRIEKNDEDLSFIYSLLTDFSTNTDWLKRRLINPTSKGATGNSIHASFVKDEVFIDPLYCDEPEEYRVIVKRDVLLNIVDTWEELTEKGVPEIWLIKDKDHIYMTDKFPSDETNNNTTREDRS